MEGIQAEREAQIPAQLATQVRTLLTETGVRAECKWADSTGFPSAAPKKPT